MTRLGELVRTHWTRGEPGREAPRTLVTFLYRLWVAALVFKTIGAAWDICWHFKWLRDDWAPPHLINTVGTVIVIGLVIFHTFTGIGADRGTLRWMQVGIATFLVAAPLDVLNHRINGLDITAWSPSHALLYIGTGAMIVGVLRGWSQHGREDRFFFPIMCFLWFNVLDLFYFLNEHQEYGILGLWAWERGTPYAEPSLLQFAADDLGRPLDRIAVEYFTLPVPDWVYPSWATVTGMITLVLVRRLVGHQWSATIVTGGYLVFRCVAWGLLAMADFPISTVPFFALAGAVVVDLSFRLPSSGYAHAVVAAALTTGATYAALRVQEMFLAAPPTDYSSGFAAAAVLAAGWATVHYLLDTERGVRTRARIAGVFGAQLTTGERASTAPRP